MRKAAEIIIPAEVLSANSHAPAASPARATDTTCAAPAQACAPEAVTDAAQARVAADTRA